MNKSAESSVGERLRLFREFKKMTQMKMAEDIGGTASGLKQNELGVSIPNGKVLIGLHELGLNVNWLLSGAGPMLLADIPGVGESSSADVKLYGDALEVVEALLEKRGKVVSPAKKRELVDVLYRASAAAKQIDSKMADMLAKLAA